MSKRIPLSLPSKVEADLRRRYPLVARLVDADPLMGEGATIPRVTAACQLIADREGRDPSDPSCVRGEDAMWMGRWSLSRQVYRVDPEVARALKARPPEGGLPCEALMRLPYPTVYVDCPVPTPQGDVGGFMAWLDSAPSGSKTALVAEFFHAGGARSPLVYFDLEPGRAVEAARAAAAASLSRSHSAWRLGDEGFAAMLALLLYVATEEEDARVVHEPPRPSRGHKVGPRTNPDRVVELGARVGRAIGEARRASEQAPAASPQGEPTGRRLAPHVRRAHWQHFWVGPRKGREDGKHGDELVVRWIPPVAVNAGLGPVTETVHESGKHRKTNQ